MIIYQLVATGESLLTGNLAKPLYSKKAFRSHAAASAYIPEFTKTVTNERDIAAIDPDTVTVNIVELELEDAE